MQNLPFLAEKCLSAEPWIWIRMTGKQMLTDPYTIRRSIIGNSKRKQIGDVTLFQSQTYQPHKIMGH